MAKCLTCSAEIGPDAAFCAKCGAKVNRPGDPGLGPPPGTPTVPPAIDTLNDRIRDHHRDGPDRDDTAETELWSGTFSPKSMIGSLVGGAALTVIIIVAWIYYRNDLGAWWWTPLVAILLTWAYLGGSLLYRQWSVRYRLTNQRFFHARGILSRTVDRIEVIDMDDITYVQGIFDRMLGTGTVKITSSDRTHPELQLVGIDDVKEVAAMIDDAKRKERIKRGLHIEQI